MALVGQSAGRVALQHAVLLINVKRRQLDVDQGGLNLRVPHELHERRQTHTAPDHV